MGAPTYAIAGGGVAAASAAEALRGAGFDGRIVIVCEEREMPYRRPPLSKELLRGELGADDVALRAPEFYERNGIELYRETRVSGLDLAKRRVLCSDGREVAFEKLLVATGASPRRLAVAGERLANIRYLRTLNDALRLQAELSSRPRVLVVGTGFIGCEVAASARQAGCDVTLVGRSSPMAHVFGNEVAALYAGRHLANGVTLKTGVTVSAFYGADAVKSARLSDGTELACDVAVVGIGVTPSIDWLHSQLAVSDGVDTDELCRTSVAGIFAAGDVACSWRPRLNRRVRLEHFDSAESQGAAAGRAMQGDTRPYDPIPFAWSDQYDLSLQYYGFGGDWDRVVVRRYSGDDSLAAFYLKERRIGAACIVNRSQDANAVKRLIGRTGIADHDLADVEKPLKSLTPAPE